MDTQAFYEGIASQLKTAGFIGDAWQKNVVAPAKQSLADNYYGNIANYNPDTRSFTPAYDRILRSAIDGHTPQPSGTPPEDYGRIGRSVYKMTNTSMGKSIADMFTGGDAAVGKQMADRSGGGFTLNRATPGGVDVNRGALLQKGLKKGIGMIPGFINKHPLMAIGGALAGTGLLAGLLHKNTPAAPQAPVMPPITINNNMNQQQKPLPGTQGSAFSRPGETW